MLLGWLNQMQLINEQLKRSMWKIKRKISFGPLDFFFVCWHSWQNFSHKRDMFEIFET